MMHSHFFKEQKEQINTAIFSLDYEKLREAIYDGNSIIIDQFLKAKEEGYKLDLDKQLSPGGNALQILMLRGDINNACKFLEAGANVTFYYRRFSEPHVYEYPYGPYWVETIWNILDPKFWVRDLTQAQLDKLTASRNIFLEKESANYENMIKPK